MCPDVAGSAGSGSPGGRGSVRCKELLQPLQVAGKSELRGADRTWTDRKGHTSHSNSEGTFDHEVCFVKVTVPPSEHRMRRMSSDRLTSSRSCRSVFRNILIPPSLNSPWLTVERTRRRYRWTSVRCRAIPLIARAAHSSHWKSLDLWIFCGYQNCKDAQPSESVAASSWCHKWETCKRGLLTLKSSKRPALPEQ